MVGNVHGDRHRRPGLKCPRWLENDWRIDGIWIEDQHGKLEDRMQVITEGVNLQGGTKGHWYVYAS